jgi:hypothetical protein
MNGGAGGAFKKGPQHHQQTNNHKKQQQQKKKKHNPQPQLSAEEQARRAQEKAERDRVAREKAAAFWAEAEASRKRSEEAADSWRACARVFMELLTAEGCPSTANAAAKAADQKLQELLDTIASRELSDNMKLGFVFASEHFIRDFFYHRPFLLV